MRKKASISDYTVEIIIAAVFLVALFAAVYPQALVKFVDLFTPNLQVSNDTLANANKDVMISSSTQSSPVLIFKEGDSWKTVDFRPFIELKSGLKYSALIYLVPEKDYINLNTNVFSAGISEPYLQTVGRIYPDNSVWFSNAIYSSFDVSADVGFSTDSFGNNELSKDKKEIETIAYYPNPGDYLVEGKVKIIIYKSKLQIEYSKLLNLMKK